MTDRDQPIGRRERKKAATRRAIADAALHLFLEGGYSAVGIRDIAAEADVAVTTLFAHFPSKEALVFEQAADFENRIVAAVAGLAEGTSLVRALHDEISALVHHCTAGDATRIWRMIEQSPELSAYAQVLELRYAQALSDSIRTTTDMDISVDTADATARFAMAAFTLARQSSTPQATLDHCFQMIDAAWNAGHRSQHA